LYNLKRRHYKSSISLFWKFELVLFRNQSNHRLSYTFRIRIKYDTFILLQTLPRKQSELWCSFPSVQRWQWIFRENRQPGTTIRNKNISKYTKLFEEYTCRQQTWEYIFIDYKW